MANKDPYSVLGVGTSATDEEIKSAYRRLSKQYHPDLHPDDANAAAKMSEVNAAYNQIKDAESRRRYTAESTYGTGNPYSNPYGPFGGYQQSYSTNSAQGDDDAEWVYTPFGAFRVHKTTYYGDGSSQNYYSGQSSYNNAYRNQSSGSYNQGQNPYNRPYRRRGFSLLRLIFMFIIISNLLTMCSRVARMSYTTTYNSGGSSPYENNQQLENDTNRNRQYY